MAEALAGDFSPSGKLPVTFYKSADQLPPFDSYDMQGRTYRYFSGEPLYPFGYGLTYSTFAFNNLTFDRTLQWVPHDDLTATVDVKNTGKLASDEVVQVYVTHPGVARRPIRALAGFQRVNLQPGELKTIAIPITNRGLSIVTPQGTRKIVPGELSVWVGDGQPAARPGLARAAGLAGTVSVRTESVLPE